MSTRRSTASKKARPAKKSAAKKTSAKKKAAPKKKATPKKKAAPTKKAAAKKKTAAKSKSTPKRATKAAAKKKATPTKKATPKKASGGRAATKKAAAKSAPKKKAATKKSAPKKAAPKKKVTTKKAAPKKKVTAKKPAAKAPRKSAAKASAPKTAKKPAAKKSAPKKTVAKKSAPKAAAKKSKSAAKASAPKAAKSGARASAPAAKSSKGRKAKPSRRGVRKTTASDDLEIELTPAPRATKVELAPRVAASVAPSIPIPVKKVPKKPTLEERAARVDKRIARQSEDFRTRYGESFDMSWIRHDSALEGVVYTYDELTTALRSDEVTVVDSSVMPIYDAIRRHKEAIDFIREGAEKKKLAINLDLLKRLYIMLHPDEGDVKTVKYRRDVPQHRTYFHEYAAPDKIAYKVRQTMDWVTDPDTKKSVSVLRIAAKAHYDLARVFPFTHDSGKVARLFMNLLLMRGGLPPAIIHETERQRYYEALKANSPADLVKMLRDSLKNSLSSIEKMLDHHETNTRGFVS